MRSLLAPLAFLIVFILVQSFATIEQYVKLITALSPKSYVGCVLIVVGNHPDLNSELLLIKYRKHLKDNYLPTGMPYLSDIKKYFIDNRTSCNDILTVVPTIDRNTMTEMKQLSEQNVLCFSKWLLFLPKFTRVDDVVDGLDIFLDCEFIVVTATSAMEVYRMRHDYPLHKIPYWTYERKDSHLDIPKIPLVKQRRNLHGLKLKVAVGKRKPYINTYQTTSGKILISGFLGDIWHSLQEELNFTSEYTVIDAGMGGSRLSNGSWIGLMAALIDEKVDIAVAPLSMTSLRVSLIEFTVQLFTTYNRIFISKSDLKNSSLTINYYLVPFDVRLWIAVGICMMAISVVLGLLYERGGHHISEAILWTIGIFCMQGFEQRQRTSSKQIAVFTSCITAVLIYQSFSANIVAETTVDVHRVPFNSLEDMLRDSTYTLGVTASSGILDYFTGATDGPAAEAYQRWLAPFSCCLPPSEWSGLHKVCSDMQYGVGHYAFAAAELVAQHFSHEHPSCHLVALPQPRTLQPFAFGLPRKSPFRDVINYKLLEMKHAGLIQRLKAHHSCYEDVSDEEQGFSPVDISHALTPFLLLVGGMTIAVLLLAAEVATKVRIQHIFVCRVYRRKLLHRLSLMHTAHFQ